jgi:hypothetical protein
MLPFSRSLWLHPGITDGGYFNPIIVQDVNDDIVLISGVGQFQGSWNQPFMAPVRGEGVQMRHKLLLWITVQIISDIESRCWVVLGDVFSNLL